MLNEDIKAYLKQIGSKGGKATGGAKAQSSRENGKLGWWSVEPTQWTRSEKNKARRVSKLALISGKLVKVPCERCGEVNSQMHHHDYTKPLEVLWLCRKCHYKEHERLRAEANKPI